MLLHNLHSLHPCRSDGPGQDKSRDPKFKDQKGKYGKRHQDQSKKTPKTFPPKAFQYDGKTHTCICAAGHQLSYQGNRKDRENNDKDFFNGRQLLCQPCALKSQCMKNPNAAEPVNGRGRQVSFIREKSRKSPYTDWMKQRVDSLEGKLIYSHRMSVVEAVFGNIGTNKKLNRFSLRGKNKVQGQWRLYGMVHNIEKIMNYGRIAA